MVMKRIGNTSTITIIVPLHSKLGLDFLLQSSLLTTTVDNQQKTFIDYYFIMLDEEKCVPIFSSFAANCEETLRNVIVTQL